MKKGLVCYHGQSNQLISDSIKVIESHDSDGMLVEKDVRIGNKSYVNIKVTYHGNGTVKETVYIEKEGSDVITLEPYVNITLINDHIYETGSINKSDFKLRFHYSDYLNLLSEKYNKDISTDDSSYYKEFLEYNDNMLSSMRTYNKEVVCNYSSSGELISKIATIDNFKVVMPNH